MSQLTVPSSHRINAVYVAQMQIGQSRLLGLTQEDEQEGEKAQLVLYTYQYIFLWFHICNLLII